MPRDINHIDELVNRSTVSRADTMSSTQIEEEHKKDLALQNAFQAMKTAAAPYKIEVMFGKGRTMNGPNLASIIVLESGKRLHGGGDQLLYQCSPKDFFRLSQNKRHFNSIKKNTVSQPGCNKFISYSNVVNELVGYEPRTKNPIIHSHAICPHCKRFWEDMSELTSEHYGRWSSQNLARLVARMWNDLSPDPLQRGDIYVKYHESDIRVVAMGSESSLEKARELKGLQIYTLGSILKDTMTGASVESRFLALFRS